jgi:hypothetical protein
MNLKSVHYVGLCYINVKLSYRLEHPVPHTVDRESNNSRHNPLFQMLYAPWLLIKAEIHHGLVVRNLQAAAMSAYKLTV